jgi:proteic killer suppression protein
VAIRYVELSRNAQKQIRRLPVHITEKLQAWVHAVSLYSLEEVRKTPGYHDEALKGQRSGQRSIRLSRGYRAIYIIKKNDSIEFVSVEEVNLHDY